MMVLCLYGIGIEFIVFVCWARGIKFFDEMPNSEMCRCLVLINFSDNIEAGCWTKTYIEVQVAVISQPND